MHVALRTASNTRLRKGSAGRHQQVVDRMSVWTMPRLSTYLMGDARWLMDGWRIIVDGWWVGGWADVPIYCMCVCAIMNTHV